MLIFFVVPSRRTLYPPWRILLYQILQGRMLMMALGRLLEAKEKLSGNCAAHIECMKYQKYHH